MLGFLKPTTAKIAGTILLVIGDWVAGFISSQLGQLLIPADLTEGMVPAFTEAFASLDIVQLIMMGLVIMVTDFLLKFILFYVIISFTIEKLVEK